MANFEDYAIDKALKHQRKNRKNIDLKGVPVIRPAGRRTTIERNITNGLITNALLIKAWMKDNDKIASGRGINSIKVRITRQPQLGSALGSVRKAARDTGGQQFSDDLKKAQSILNLTDIGLVSGQIVAAPHLKYALEGRGPGKAPPVSVIAQWMADKGLKPMWSGSAYLIARKIGEQGTNGPYFTQPILTTMTRASISKSLNAIKKPLARVIGRRFVRFLMKSGEFWENMEITSPTVTLYNKDQDQGI